MDNIGTLQPQVIVRLRRSASKNTTNQAWKLVLEINNVVRNGKYTKIYEAVHRSVTTPIWDKDKKNNYGFYHPKRNSNGVILCESDIDQEACLYADKIRQKRQHDNEIAILYDGHEEELSEKDKKRRKNVLTYFREVAENRHPDKISSQQAWLIAADKLEKFLNGKMVCFKDINLRFVNDYRSFLLTMHNERHVKNLNKQVSSTTAARYFMFFRAVLHQAYSEGYMDVDIASKTTAMKKRFTCVMHSQRG
ncbi:phage integrase SAM-like domain-containing protein [Hoylesella nanceiensis]|jgi:hypothetical protein|uniref:phage integrase SAM-like domain-containing protein n=1 Tax=Hoylesella nanceiensis TaxID=425941 RepID=UPI002150BE2F|nr:phage integrase SAM-like domain-containing protein [Hoylesella nanceiensis]